MANVAPGNTQLPENRLVTTDASGRYEFTGLPAGRYNVTATKEATSACEYGQLRPFEPGKPVEILDGQTDRANRLRIAAWKHHHRTCSG